MNESALRSQAQASLDAERRAREQSTTDRSISKAVGGGETTRIFRRSGEIVSLGGRVTGGRKS